MSPRNFGLRGPRWEGPPASDVTPRRPYSVRYYAGPYGGTRTVRAEDSEDAIRQVRAWVRKVMTLSQYADGYRVLDP